MMIAVSFSSKGSTLRDCVIYVAINASGTHRVKAQLIPANAIMVIPAVAEDAKIAKSMHIAKNAWEIAHA